ncbi:MAG TPA: dihydrodipicolinate reductase C-terminal domain-containing protein [Synergistaceae bacterium]|nr:dihydrodipicolinate reductase C-terminal domain-containing protein [Synergistaceae bacterium]
MKKVFVSGASGNVGKVIVKALLEREDMELAGGYCREAGEDLGTLVGAKPAGITATDNLAEGLKAACPDMVIDFTSATVLMENLKLYAELGLDAVIGTTGLGDEDVATAEKLVREKGLRFAMVPNFGLGITLVMDFIAKARQFYPYVSIVDRHPPTMANAPSGTAGMLARGAAEGPRGEVASKETFPGVLGGTIAEQQVLSQRMPYPGPFSEHEIKLGRQDEVITVTVSDFTSAVYLDGIFLVAEKLSTSPKGTLIRTLDEAL